jgi:hypothetical protein
MRKHRDCFPYPRTFTTERQTERQSGGTFLDPGGYRKFVPLL